MTATTDARPDRRNRGSAGATLFDQGKPEKRTVTIFRCRECLGRPWSVIAPMTLEDAIAAHRLEHHAVRSGL